MSENRLNIIKIVSVSVAGLAILFSGLSFYKHRHYQETVVLGPGVTEVKKLSNYFAPLKGTMSDCNIYILDSGNPGGTIMAIGGTHPEEPASHLVAQLMVETAKVAQGKLVIAIRANRSASTVTRPGDAYPQFYHIATDWGEKKFRMGDRWSNPLDSWPDPEVYVHYPSKQMLAYADIRNLNRTWPGRADGTSAEQTCYAFTRVIEEEQVDVFIDFHEAELEYPVISTIVSHQNATEIAAMASMMLSAGEFKRPIGMEYSPPSLHGLSHREIGDHTRAMSLLFEAPEPFLDRVRGITDETLLLTGRDAFVMKAGEHGLLYEQITEEGWPIDVRVGRHASTTLMVAELWTEMNPDKPVVIEDVPAYAQVIAHKVGHYFQNPDDADPSRVVYE